MRRFDQALLFDALAQTGGLDRPLMDALADHIAQFHPAAERRPDQGGAAALRDIAETNHQVLAAVRGAVFARERVEAILDQWRAALATADALIETRKAAGKVRRCHGDLHLRNICLLDGKPTLFDCLEFSDALASIDILYDLAFLLMDLEHRGLAHLANRVLNRYLDRTERMTGWRRCRCFCRCGPGFAPMSRRRRWREPPIPIKKRKWPKRRGDISTLRTVCWNHGPAGWSRSAA